MESFVRLRSNGPVVFAVDADSSMEAGLKHLPETDTGPLVLYSFNEVDPWQQTNPDIRHYYRCRYSLRACLRSLFTLHNETQNIWSHAFATLVFAAMLANQPATMDAVVLAELSAYIITFGSSVVAHTFFALPSRKAVEIMFNVDRAGIALGIFSCSFCAGHYQYACDPDLQLAYQAASVSLLLATWVFILRIDQTSARHALMLQMCLGLQILLSLIPIVGASTATYSDLDHALHAQGISTASVFVVLLCAASAFFYSSRVPERLWPGRFDLLLSGHSIMHWTSAGSALAAYFGIQHWRQLRVLEACEPIPGAALQDILATR